MFCQYRGNTPSIPHASRRTPAIARSHLRARTRPTHLIPSGSEMSPRPRFRIPNAAPSSSPSASLSTSPNSIPSVSSSAAEIAGLVPPRPQIEGEIGGLVPFHGEKRSLVPAPNQLRWVWYPRRAVPSFATWGFSEGPVPNPTKMAETRGPNQGILPKTTLKMPSRYQTHRSWQRPRRASNRTASHLAAIYNETAIHGARCASIRKGRTAKSAPRSVQGCWRLIRTAPAASARINGSSSARRRPHQRAPGGCALDGAPTSTRQLLTRQRASEH